MSAATKEKPLTRMISYVGMKMETLELTHADKIPKDAENDGTEMAWRSEFAKAEHAILDEISKTLTLVQAYEGDFKQILQRKMGKKKPTGR